MSIFEIASRKKLRVQTERGELTVEQLWDLPLKANGKLSLDGIATNLYSKLESTKVSFVDNVVEDSDNQILFDIVLHIIKVRKDEILENQERAKNASTLRLLKEILAKQELNQLESLTSEELKAKISELESKI